MTANTPANGFGFIKLINTRLPILFQYIQSKDIAGRDLSVLLCCLYFTNWKTGKCRVTTRRLSDTLSTAQTNIRASIRRLRACKLIAEAQDRDGTSYLIPHPKLFQCSTGRARGLLLRAFYLDVYGPSFHELVEDEELEAADSRFSPETFTPGTFIPAGDDFDDSDIDDLELDDQP